MQKISKENAEYFTWGDHCDGWFLAKHPNACVIQERMLPHTSEVKHYHEKTWQFLFILSGTLSMEIGNKEFTLEAFEGIEMQPTIPHNFFNRTDKDIHYILVSAPFLPSDRINIEEKE